MPTDADLLRAHHAGDPAAFGALVARHLDWTYAVARRRTGDGHAAEDVTQAAFLALAGRRVPDQETTMAPWLFGVVRNLAAKSARAAARRRRHETAAALPPGAAGRDDGGDAWPLLAAALDELIAGLPRADAEAVLLRFYERLPSADVAAALGVTESAVRKRVGRAVEKLRTRFARRGLTPEMAAMDAGLVAHVAPPAPPGLTAAIGRPATLASRSGRWTVAAGGVGGVVGVVGLVVAVFIARTPVRPTPPAVSPVDPPVPAPVESAALPATRPSPLTIDDVIAGLRANEDRLRTLEIRNFRTVVDEGDTPEGPWRETPMGGAGSAWFDGRVGGKARIDYSRQTSLWTSGAAPYYVTQQSASWDGTLSQRLDLRCRVWSPHRILRERVRASSRSVWRRRSAVVWASCPRSAANAWAGCPHHSRPTPATSEVKSL